MGILFYGVNYGTSKNERHDRRQSDEINIEFNINNGGKDITEFDINRWSKVITDRVNVELGKLIN